MDQRSAQALIRFGLGRRGKQDVPADPVAWLTAQVTGADPARFSDLPTTAGALTILREQREADRARRIAEAEAAKAAPPGVAPPASLPPVIRPTPANAPPAMAAAPAPPRPAQQLFRDDATAQLAWAIGTDAPYRERLVWFWTNHFTVSLRQGGIAPLIGPYIREAIRPYVTGRFTDMVLAVMRHPAMLMYLDQEGSVGPDSMAGQRQHRGLNENLARECMELHTVTPAAGYTQADVTQFARILTGWSVEMKGERPGFAFRSQAHEPGPKILLGQGFPPGEEGGILALRYLAEHPATYAALARRLVQYFVADTPPPDAVRRINQVLTQTRGDLGAAAVALVHLPAAWQGLNKLRSPQEYIVAAVRALDLPPDKAGDLIGQMGALGQPLWNAPLPNGWGDRAGDWSAPEALLRRADWAFGLAGRAGDLDPMEVADAALGPLLRPQTREAIQHAGSRRDGLTLLLASCEFMRR